MRRAGAVLVDVKIPDLQKFGDAENLILQYEFKDGIEEYLSGRNSRYRTLDDLIEFNKDNAAEEMPVFGQDVFEASAKRGDLSMKEYRKALDTARKCARKEGIDKVMDDHKLDAVVAPSNGPDWRSTSSAATAAAATFRAPQCPPSPGYPNITVPPATSRSSRSASRSSAEPIRSRHSSRSPIPTSRQAKREANRNSSRRQNDPQRVELLFRYVVAKCSFQGSLFSFQFLRLWWLNLAYQVVVMPIEPPGRRPAARCAERLAFPSEFPQNA